MKLIILILILASSAFALEEQEILDLSKKEESRNGISEAMKLFPNVANFEVSYTIHTPKGFPKNNKGPIVKDKFVEGKYLISEFTIGDEEHKFDLINVTYYVEEELCYYRWVLNKQLKTVYEYRGVRAGESNIIGWTMINPKKHGYDTSLFIE